MRALLSPLLALLVVAASGCPSCDGENLANPCRYQLTLRPDQQQLPVNTRLSLKAVVTMTDCSEHDFTGLGRWSSSDGAVATVDSGSHRGEVTGRALGIATISAAVLDLDASTLVLVIPAPLVSIAVTPERPATTRGAPLQFVAMGSFADGSVLDVSSLATWTSSNPAVASVSSESGSKGLAVGLEAGITEVQASFNGVAGSTALTVTPAALTLVSLWPPLVDLAAGTAQPFTAMAIYDDFSVQDVTATAQWGTAQDTVATVAADRAGWVKALGAGTTTVTAQLFGVSGSSQVRVSGATLAAVALEPGRPQLAAGTAGVLVARGRFSDQTVQDVSALATWSSQDPGVATVSNELATRGQVQALASGSAVVNAAVGTTTGSALLSVSSAALQELSVTPGSPALAPGTRVSLTATGLFADDTSQDLTGQVQWNSSAPAAASVDTLGRVSAHGPGSALISASLGERSTSVPVTVSSATVDSISVSPSHAAVTLEGRLTLSATALFTDGTTQDVSALATWVSSEEAVVRVSNAPGLRGSVVGMRAGSATVTASFQGVQGFTTVAVSPATLLALTLDPEHLVLARGTQGQLRLLGNFSDNVTRDVTDLGSWSSGSPGIVSVSNAPAGQVTAQREGVATVTVAWGGQTAQADISVTAAAVTGLSVAPPAATLAKGTSQQFTATATFTDGSTQDVSSVVTWRSAQPGIASISNAPGSRGRANALAEGSTTLTVRFQGQVAQAALSVRSATLATLAINPSAKTLALGTSQYFAALGTFTDHSTQDLTQDVTWLSADVEVADVSNVDDGTKGMATALRQGTTLLTATLGAISGTAQVTVTDASLRAIAIVPAEVSMARGATRRLTALGTYSDNSTEDITSTAVWSSSNETVASLSRTTRGLVYGRTEGEVLITASLAGVSGTARVGVLPKVMVSISVSPGFASVADETVSFFQATAIYSDNSTEDITSTVLWASGNLELARVSNGGDSRGRVSANAPGTVLVYASAAGMIGTATLEVRDAQPVTLVLAPEAPKVAAGYALPLRAVGTFSDGSVQDITDSVTWTTAQTAVARVATSGKPGVVTGVAVGSTNVQASFWGVRANTTLTVTNATLQSLEVAADRAQLPAGASTAVRATGTFSDGSAVDLGSQAAWSTSNPDQLVYSEGRAWAGTAGSATLSATLSGVTGFLPVTVTDAVLTGLAVDPAALSLAVHGAQALQATGTYSDGSVLDVSATVTWFTSDASAAVSNGMRTAGWVYGLMAGTPTVRAVSGTVEASASITVAP